MRYVTLVFAVFMLAITPAATAAPDGFRKSEPLTQRAQTLAWNKKITVHCAATRALYESTNTPETHDSLGRIHPDTLEIELPPVTCAPMERWLKGKKVDLYDLGSALATLAHEVGHAELPNGDEDEVDCYARQKYGVIARLFGIRKPETLRAVRLGARLPYC